jgi:hypothetical protein
VLVAILLLLLPFLLVPSLPISLPTCNKSGFAGSKASKSCMLAAAAAAAAGCCCKLFVSVRQQPTSLPEM